MSEELLFLGKTIEAIQNMRVAAQVRISHLKKNDKKCDLTENILVHETKLEGIITEILAEKMKDHPAYEWFSKVKGIGLVNIGKVVSYIDIERAETISKLWRYAGFSVNSDGKAERRTKGEKAHFNNSLKSMCWRLGKSLIRVKGSYYDFYIKQKKRLIEKAEDRGQKIVPSKELPKIKGKHIETDEFFGLGHIDMMAMRKMIKLFLAHLWLVWRVSLELNITEPYVQAIKGHSNIESPFDFIEP